MNLTGLSQNEQQYIMEMVERRNSLGVFSPALCQEILEYTKAMGFEAAYGIACYYFAEVCWLERDADKTMRYLTESTKCFLTKGLYELLARSCNMMGSVCDSLDNRVVALNYFYTGLQYAEKCGLTYERGIIDFNIGFVLFRMKQYQEAIGHYESAVRAYKMSQDNYYRSYNMALAMQHCGSCYLKLGRKKDAYGMLEEIEELLHTAPGRAYPQKNVVAFRAECAAAQGRREAFLQGVEELLGMMRAEKEIGEEADNLESLAALLYGDKELDKLDELFQVLDQKGLENTPLLFMSLYTSYSDSLLERGKTQEYIAYTEKYFSAYEKDRQNHKLAAIRLLELQEELRAVEREQARVSADNKRLEAMAMYDSLTKLANRARINEHMERMFDRARQEKALLGVELLDIDFFKSYNDLYGHLAGDECIKAVAGVLKNVEKEGVFCGRYGGDEFVVIYSGMTPAQIEATAKRIQEGVRDLRLPHEGSACFPMVTVSQGIYAGVPDEASREWDFNAMADEALYDAKRAGRNCYQIAADSA